GESQHRRDEVEHKKEPDESGRTRPVLWGKSHSIFRRASGPAGRAGRPCHPGIRKCPGQDIFFLASSGTSILVAPTSLISTPVVRLMSMGLPIISMEPCRLYSY